MWACQSRTWKELFLGLLQVLSPGSCHACGGILAEWEKWYCPSCLEELNKHEIPRCDRCCAPVGPYLDTSNGCSLCQAEPFAFQWVQTLGCYQGPLRDWVLKCKNHAGEILGYSLGFLLGEKIKKRNGYQVPDLVAPVPMHWWKRIKKGYCHTECLAQGVSQALGVPCRNVAFKSRHTREQAALPPSQRRKNLDKVFFCPSSGLLSGKRVLLVDDVLTTGSTCHQVSRELKRAGAMSVVVGVIARSA